MKLGMTPPGTAPIAPPFVATLLLTLSTSTLACGLTVPIQNGGAAITADGISVAVLRQRCSESVQARQPGNDLIEATIEVQVHNSTATPLAVQRDAFRLTAPDGTAIRTSTWFAKDPLAVESGQTQTFELRFMSRGGLSCWKPMELRADAAVTRGAEPVKIGSVQFTASRALPGYGRR